MNIRRIYATAATIFALFTTFYAVMTLAFFFGEGHTEWGFPLFITVVAGIAIWSAVSLWRKGNALLPTTITLLAVFGITSWIIVSPETLDPSFLLIVLVALLALALLVGVATKNVREALRA